MNSFPGISLSDTPGLSHPHAYSFLPSSRNPISYVSKTICKPDERIDPDFKYSLEQRLSKETVSLAQLVGANLRWVQAM